MRELFGADGFSVFVPESRRGSAEPAAPPTQQQFAKQLRQLASDIEAGRMVCEEVLTTRNSQSDKTTISAVLRPAQPMLIDAPHGPAPCDCCGNPSTGVFASNAGAASFAYCYKCCVECAEPLVMLIHLYANVADGDISRLHPDCVASTSCAFDGYYIGLQEWWPIAKSGAYGDFLEASRNA